MVSTLPRFRPRRPRSRVTKTVVLILYWGFKKVNSMRNEEEMFAM